MTRVTPSAAPPAASVGASAGAIQHHYDVGNPFYELWLDPTLTYSCARWEPGDALEEAQIRKLDLIIGLGGASGKARVLDIGCGWGSCLDRLVRHHRVGEAVGLTMSRSQA